VPLIRDVLHGQPAHAGDGYPYGSGSEQPRGAVAGVARRTSGDGARSSAGPGSGVGSEPCDGRVRLWNHVNGSTHSRWGLAAINVRGHARQLSSRPAGDKSQSDGGAKIRIKYAPAQRVGCVAKT
jgi:hypothetical protein